VKKNSQYLQGSRKSQIFLGVFLTFTLVVISIVLWWFYENTKVVNQLPVENQTTDANLEDQQASEQAILETKPKFDAVKLQKAVDGWISSLPESESSDASVSIVDLDSQTTLASTKPDKQYFSASLYKLFVAYEGYKAIDAGILSPEEEYQNGRTRLECLDAMIRSSDSPCAEKMWSELGRENIEAKIKEYGIGNTDMVGLRTTSEDVAKILVRIATGEGLSADSQANYLDSMKDQEALYRRGLPSGFSSSITVYNKVGWNEQLEWHDASIIEFLDGRRLVLSVLTSGVGTANIKKLAAAIEAASK
jgi:beta-lactamase class A